jgi:hypothetical protein
MSSQRYITSRDAFFYAQEVIKGRWLEGEPAIMADAHWACVYAIEIIQGRWPEAEKYIIAHPNTAFNYAHKILKERWYDAEELICQDYFERDRYIIAFFPNQTVVTKDEVGEFEWSRLDLPGYFASAEIFKRKASLLDMVIE